MTSHICSLMKLKTFGVPSQWYKCCPAHRSMVAWCMGVVPVPGLTAVNGPFLRECIKLSTGTVVLRGSLPREKGYDVTLDLCSNKLINIWSQSDSTSVGVYSLRISQLFACCLGVLLGPAVPTNTPPTCASTVHLQDVPSWRETHCRKGGEKRSHCFSRVCFRVCVDKAGQSEAFTLPGKVVLTEKLDTQVISSSPSLQSFSPSQAWSNGINLTERLQKKYLLSISCLTAEKRRSTMRGRGRT